MIMVNVRIVINVYCVYVVQLLLDCDTFWDSFLNSYKQTILDHGGITVFQRLWDEETVVHAGIHWGSEVLARTVGKFQTG